MLVNDNLEGDWDGEESKLRPSSCLVGASSPGNRRDQGVLLGHTMITPPGIYTSSNRRPSCGHASAIAVTVDISIVAVGPVASYIHAFTFLAFLLHGK